MPHDPPRVTQEASGVRWRIQPSYLSATPHGTNSLRISHVVLPESIPLGSLPSCSPCIESHSSPCSHPPACWLNRAMGPGMFVYPACSCQYLLGNGTGVVLVRVQGKRGGNLRDTTSFPVATQGWARLQWSLHLLCFKATIPPSSDHSPFLEGHPCHTTPLAAWLLLSFDSCGQFFGCSQ
jgi:hypothetical protein